MLRAARLRGQPSAGTYILYAAHIAAMAPATTLGAATPVAIGLPGSERKPPPDDKGSKPGGGSSDTPKGDAGKGDPKPATPPLGPADAMTAKQVHDASAFIRGLAQQRGRNAEWAERAVREAVSLTASEALRDKVVDIVAEDLGDLLAQIDGRRVRVHGAVVTLATRGVPVETLLPDWRQRLLSVIANPSFALILMMVGIYGLMFEFSSPGFGVPGTVGAICLLLALFALQLLPVNYAGLGGVLVPLLLLLAASSLRILREYQRGVVFQLGRIWKVKGPGLVLVIPGIQQMVRVDLRVVTMDVEPQDVISHDNVSVKVNAVVFFCVVAPEEAIIQVQDYPMATSQLAQTTLRVVLGKHELDEMLAERERLNLDVQQILDAQTDAWGIKVTNVEIKHIDLNESMVRAIARQAEAERERRAKVIHAEGEKQASAALLEAARMLAQQPEAMQLRYLQTMTQVAGDRASTVVMPLPLDMLGSLFGKSSDRGAATTGRDPASGNPG